MQVAAGLALWLVWQFPVYGFLRMPPRLAFLWFGAIAAFFLWCHAARDGWGSARGRATARVRPIPRGAIGWRVLLAPVMAAGALAMWMIVTSLGWARDTPLPEVLQEYGDQRGGDAVLLVLIVGMAPLLEEFGFRGWVQRPLERRLGPAPAIGITALLFAAAHLEPGGAPIRIFGGMALGYAVWATRSIWAGVALHVAWNTGVLLFGAVFPTFDPAARGPWLALPAFAVFLASAAVYALIAPRLRASRRAAE